MPRPLNEDDPWERAAARLALDALPPLTTRILDLGHVDAELTSMETEVLPDLLISNDGSWAPVPGTINRSVTLDRAFAISNLWVMELYELVRYLGDTYPRTLTGETETRQNDLKGQLALIRIPLAKFETRLRSDQIQYPASIIVVGDASLGWRVYDKYGQKHEISRRALKERFFEMANDFTYEDLHG